MTLQATLPNRPPPKDRTDFLLSWDRLGFRLLLFGGLGIMWVIQARMLHQPWLVIIRTQLTSVLPWAFVAPIVLAVSRRARIDELGLPRFLGAHLLGMIAVYIPFWMLYMALSTLWIGFANGWALSHFMVLKPTAWKLMAVFIDVPFMYLVILLGAEAMRQAQGKKEQATQAELLKGQLAEARLALLQRQLHPHFLFNALQAISTLLHRDPLTADVLLVRLSTLLRALLEQASGQTLSLRTELDLTRKYLEIEQARFADRLTVEWTVDEALLEIQVPSLIVLPLVENAIRHGLSPKMGPGRLHISAISQGASLILTVADDGLGTTLPLRSGVGIGNTRERLEALYGERAQLEIDTLTKGGFCAKIQIPLPEKRP